jgi:hypothetical protein
MDNSTGTHFSFDLCPAFRRERPEQDFARLHRTFPGGGIYLRFFTNMGANACRAMFLLALFALVAGGCSRKAHVSVLNIRVTNGGTQAQAEKERGAGPVEITVTLDDAPLAEGVKVKEGEPLVLKKELPGPGNYTVRVEEKNTDSARQSVITVKTSLWMDFAFYRESANMGYFELSSGDAPWSGSGGEATAEKTPPAGGGDVDSKLEVLRVESAKKRAERAEQKKKGRASPY